MAGTETPQHQTDEPLAMRWSAGRILAVVAGLSMALFWLWIFSGAPARDNPDRLDDRAYAADLEERCEQLRDDIDTLPPTVTIDSPDERIEVLRTANGFVAAFIDDVEAGAPTSGDAATSVEGWLADWRTYLENREDYARRLASDPDARFLLDQSPLGDSVDKTIEIFAQVNDIRACATPGDVG